MERGREGRRARQSEGEMERGKEGEREKERGYVKSIRLLVVSK